MAARSIQRLRDIIDTIDILDDLWASRAILVYDIVSFVFDDFENGTLCLITGAFSDISEAFPRDMGNPEIIEMFEFYRPYYRDEKPKILELCRSLGLDLEMEYEVANPPGLERTLH